MKETRSAGEQPGIIGGMFGLQIPLSQEVAFRIRPNFLQSPHRLLTTARSAFTLLMRHLKPQIVWLPSYLCRSILDSFAEVPVKFYEVNENLQIKNPNWIDKILYGDLVIFIDYFGFNSWNSYAQLVRERGAWIVEDASQALLNNCFSKDADYIICSPRKFLGVPDGGILLAREDVSLPEVDLASTPSTWWLESLTASLLRGEFDRHGGEREWFNIFQRIDSIGPIEPAQMSQLSQFILENTSNYKSMADRRKSNFSYLAGRFKDISVFPKLLEGTVPLGFPIRLKKRDEVQRKFFSKNIFPAIHWPIAGIVPLDFRVSHLLASEILTLPIDQRYSLQDMKLVATVLEENLQ